MSTVLHAKSFCSPIKEIVTEIRVGRMVVLVDEGDRENEGNLVIAAEYCTKEAIVFMLKYGHGLLRLTLTEDHWLQLGLGQMALNTGTPRETVFPLSIEAAAGVTTGFSADDRSHTVRTAVDRNAKPSDLSQPGHVFPVAARPGGVLVRAGHAEAGCDMARLAGLEPAAVMCEMLTDEGCMARLPDLIEFAKLHGLKIGVVSDLVDYCREMDPLVERGGDPTDRSASLLAFPVRFRRLSVERKASRDCLWRRGQGRRFCRSRR